MAKASDFSKRLKAKHLGGKPRDLTIGQVGVEKMQRRNKPDITIFAAEGMQSPDEIKTENVIYLWFRELGATRSMRVNETNLDTLITARGDDFKNWINCKITLTPESIMAFGKPQETIVISNVRAPAPKPAPANVNPQTGEIKEPAPLIDIVNTAQPELVTGSSPLTPTIPVPSHATKDSFFAYAEQIRMKKEAQNIANAHAKDQDWTKAMQELIAAGNPQLA